MAPASACSRRNTVHAAATSSASKRKSAGSKRLPQYCARWSAKLCERVQMADRSCSGAGPLQLERLLHWPQCWRCLWREYTATASGGGGNASVKEPGFLGGAQVGANYQTGSVVWGLEA